MNDRRLDRLIVAARANSTDQLSGSRFRRAGEELLEQIMALPETVTTVPSDQSAGSAGSGATFDVSGYPRPVATGRTHWTSRRRAVVGLIAAAVAAVAVSVPTLYLRSGSPAVVEVLPAATENGVPAPGLLLDDPAFSIGYVQGSVTTMGEIQFVDGKRDLQINWYPKDQYQGALDDRKEDGAPRPVQVVGLDAQEFRSDAGVFTAVLPPQGETFYYISGSVGDRAAFEAVLGRLRHVTQADWDAAMPADVVTPGRERQVAGELLRAVPLPPGLDIATLPTGQTNDRYQFSAHVFGQVMCGWLADYQFADRIGDKERIATAKRAFRSSHDWAGLKAMVDEGDYAEVLWEYADAAASGSAVKPGSDEVTVANSYEAALGCD